MSARPASEALSEARGVSPGVPSLSLQLALALTTQMAVLAVSYAATCLGITVGFHRLGTLQIPWVSGASRECASSDRETDA